MTELDFNPIASELDRDRPEVFYAKARDAGVVWSESFRCWMVARYADVVAVTDDPETFVSAYSVPSLADCPPEVLAELGGAVEQNAMVVNSDGPEHARLREVFDRGVEPERIRASIPTMQAWAEELIDGFVHAEDRTVELRAQFAEPYVQVVANRVFGMPTEDAGQVGRWAEQFVQLHNPMASPPARIEAARQVCDYATYLDGLIAARRAEPEPDVISELVAHADAVGMNAPRLRYQIAGNRLAAIDTTRDSIVSTCELMLRNGYWNLARRATHPGQVIQRCIEEALRTRTPHRGLMRTTMRDVELGGQRLAAGSTLLLLFGAASRDDVVFADPDRVDIDRRNTRDHVAFGRGVHACAGKGLARLEIRVAVEALLRRLPGARLAEGPLSYAPSYFFWGLQALRLEW